MTTNQKDALGLQVSGPRRLSLLTRTLPLTRPLGLPIYVASVPVPPVSLGLFA